MFHGVEIHVGNIDRDNVCCALFIDHCRPYSVVTRPIQYHIHQSSMMSHSSQVSMLYGILFSVLNSMLFVFKWQSKVYMQGFLFLQNC